MSLLIFPPPPVTNMSFVGKAGLPYSLQPVKPRSLTVRAQWVFHVVHSLVSLGLECLSMLGKIFLLMTVNSIHYHSLVGLRPLLLGAVIVLTPLSLALSTGLTAASCLLV